MKTFTRSLIYLVIFAVISFASGIFVVNAINRPLTEAADTYHADFTNAAGLRVGNDVRLLGKQIGKVTAIDLEQSSDGVRTWARVSFTAARGQHLYPNTKLAIKYVNLTGIRYIDMARPAPTGKELAPGSTLSTEQTIPSFDVTRIFKGFAPVLHAMSPDDINHFAQSMLTLVQGDGSGLGPVLESLSKVVRYTDNRSMVINTLIGNLREISSSLGGKSGHLGPILGYLEEAMSTLFALTDQFRSLADTGGPLFIALDELLAELGLTTTDNKDAHIVLGQIMPFAKTMVGLLGLTPGILRAINSITPGAPTSTKACSKGQAPLPDQVSLLLRGAAVTLCNR